MLTTFLAVPALVLIVIILHILVLRSNPGAIFSFFRVPKGIKRAEEELKLKSELLDAATDSVFLHDLDMRILYLNRTAYESSGYTREELMSLGLRALITPEFDAKSEERINAVLDKGETVFESCHVRKDGSIMPVEIHNRVIELGNSKAILTIVRDISDRKRAEAKLWDAIQTLESLVQSSPLGISMLDRDGKVTRWNLACERIFGWTAQRMARWLTSASRRRAFLTPRTTSSRPWE
ncbi:MAG: PAS domain S-box protein [Dehalococcoidia bacterium]|nr:PAS domain S-box protein [Dehalococcoidia bacterium]